MTSKVKVRGLKELERAMVALPDKLAKKHLTAAVRQGARLIGTEARAFAVISEDTGRLRKNIVWFKMRERSSLHSVSFGIRPRSSRKKSRDDPKNAWYWAFVEFGTRFQPAQPFLRPAFEFNKRRAVGVIARVLRKGLQTEARKV